jgi:hypothetical protein
MRNLSPLLYLEEAPYQVRPRQKKQLKKNISPTPLVMSQTLSLSLLPQSVLAQQEQRTQEWPLILGTHLAIQTVVDEFDEHFFLIPENEVLSSLKYYLDTFSTLNKVRVDHFKSLHKKGYLPIVVEFIPEGLAATNAPFISISATEPKFNWLVSHITALMIRYVTPVMKSAQYAAHFKKILVRVDAEQGNGEVLSKKLSTYIPSMGLDDCILDGIGKSIYFEQSNSASILPVLAKYYKAKTFVSRDPCFEVEFPDDLIDLLLEYPDSNLNFTITSDLGVFIEALKSNADFIQLMKSRTAEINFKLPRQSSMNILLGTAAIIDVLNKESVTAAGNGTVIFAKDKGKYFKCTVEETNWSASEVIPSFKEGGILESLCEKRTSGNLYFKSVPLCINVIAPVALDLKEYSNLVDILASKGISMSGVRMGMKAYYSIPDLWEIECNTEMVDAPKNPLNLKDLYGKYDGTLSFAKYSNLVEEQVKNVNLSNSNNLQSNKKDSLFKVVFQGGDYVELDKWENIKKRIVM